MFGLTPFERTFDAFRRFDDDFFRGMPLPPAQPFRTDIKEDGDNYVMESELPGFEKEDIKLDVTGNTLTLSAEHSSEKSEDDNQGNYIRRERSFGSYRRSFDIRGIDTDSIEAEYKNGILKLVLPKQIKKEAETKNIEIK